MTIMKIIIMDFADKSCEGNSSFRYGFNRLYVAMVDVMEERKMKEVIYSSGDHLIANNCRRIMFTKRSSKTALNLLRQ